MNTVYTTDSLSAVAQLYSEAASVPPSKTAVAAMVTEAFINGMTARDMLAAPSSRPVHKKTAAGRGGRDEVVL